MSDDFIVKEKLEVQRCHTCGIIFAIPAGYAKNRREDGVSFRCPNGHSLSWPKKDENGETTTAKIERLEEENSELKSKNIQLLAKLDQAEARLEQTPPDINMMLEQTSQESDEPENSEEE